MYVRIVERGRAEKRELQIAKAILFVPLAMLVSSVSLAQSAITLAGSGVVVGSHGEILTNAHVVEACKNITVALPSQSPQTAVLAARDQKNDLAVIRINSSPSPVAAFREGVPLRAGDAVVTLGYPLSGLLATSANLSVGIVSALADLDDDTRYFQISAPVQPGNSGGPLLDASGHVVGIVTAKLDAMRVAQFTGDIPQNVNFAVKAEVAKAFLDSKGVDYQVAPSVQQLSPADVGDIARPFTVYIECRQAASQSATSITTPTAKTGASPVEIRTASLRRCVKGENPDIRIAGCSALIQSRQEPTDILAFIYWARGTAYSAKEQDDRAIQDYDQAIKLQPNYSAAFVFRGDAYRFKHQNDRAIQDYDQAIALNPKDANAFSSRADAHFAKGQDAYRFGDGPEYDRAIEDYDEAIKIKSNNSGAFVGRGNTYVLKKQYDRAVQDYDHAITLKPNYPYAFIKRAIAFEFLGRIDRAMEDCNEAIRLDPNSAPAFYERSTIKQLFLHDTAGGDADLARAQELGSQ